MRFRLLKDLLQFMKKTMMASTENMAASSVNASATKRTSEDVTSESTEKKRKVEENQTNQSRRVDGLPYKKKMAALLMMFCGKDFYGMQANAGVATISGTLLEALVKAGVVLPTYVEEPRKQMSYSLASRTDKGVSALGMVVSCKMFSDVENALEKINSHLPGSIKILEILWTTKTFDSKHWADARTYTYTLPTMAFTPHDQEVKESYIISAETLERLNKVLALFVGTHNFHNYTSGKKPTDPSCKRYIKEISAGKVFVREDIEFIIITLYGQSFMLHQIRKMIGMAIAVIQGLANEDYLLLAFTPERVDVPRAPPVGLLLREIHFNSYNKKFSSDGLHKPFDFKKYKDEVDAFEEKYILPTLIAAEKNDYSITNWVSDLRDKHFERIQTVMKGEPLEPTADSDSNHSEKTE